MTFLRSPLPHELRPNPRRIDAIREEIRFLHRDIADEESRIADAEANIEEAYQEIEKLEAEMKELEAAHEVLLDPFGYPYPGPGEYGERLLDEATRMTPPPPYGASLTEIPA